MISDVQDNKKAAHPPSERGTSRTGSSFDPRNTFASFVAGDNNNFAYAAAMAVAQAPGRSYNPLFLYGGAGLGKTHLLHAIGQQVLGQQKAARVAYLSSESFVNDYIDAIQDNQLARFRKKYRQLDVLLLDDVQYLASTERVQEEFFHTFNALHVGQKQIVVTCDRMPSQVPNLEQRLVSRFECGLATKLQPPDGELRLAILNRKAQLLGIELPKEILEFLANRIRTNVRRLEGALMRLAAYAVLIGKKPSLDAVETLLRELLDEEGPSSVDIQLIQKRVAEHFGVRLADMTSQRRSGNVAFPREVAMYLSRQLTDNSLTAIGNAFGGRYHGTVLHACHLIKDRMEVDPNIREVIGYLERQLAR